MREKLWTVLIVIVVLVPWLSSCSVCPAINKLAMRPMAYEPIFHLEQGACEPVAAPDNRATTGPFFADAACSKKISYTPLPYRRFCKDNLAGNDHTREYIGNPAAWHQRELDPVAPGETTWSLSQGSRLHITVVNQTKHNHRPYLKRVDYRQVDGCALAMHIYKSRVDATGLKPLIFFYGGGWSHRGALAVAGMETLAPNLTDKGYIVFAPFYRVLKGSTDGPKECLGAVGTDIIADIEAAFTWVLSHGEDYGMAAPTKVATAGQSSGAQLAGYLAINHPDKVTRALLLYPPTDLTFLVENLQPGGIYDGKFDEAKKLILRFLDAESLADIDLSDPFVIANSYPEKVNPSPTGYPPIFMIHGDADDVVPVEQSTRLCEGLDPNQRPSKQLYPGGDKVRACGSESELHVIAGANHVLDLRCFTGKYTDIFREVFHEDLCPSGYPGEKKVRAALEKAYSQF